MTAVAEKLKRELGALTPKERDELIFDLVSEADPSFSAKILPGLTDEWEAKIAKRIDDFESGRIKGIPHEEVMQKLREQIANG